jgi:hypothetical protein
MNVVALLVGLGLTAFTIAIKRSSLAAIRRKLGTEVHEIRLYRPWVRVLQFAFLAVGAAFPAFAIVVWVETRGSLEDLPRDMGTSLWLASNAFALTYGGRLMIGERGFVVGPGEIVEWSQVESVGWDRDIGQRQYGLSVRLRECATDKVRMFVRRDMKPDVEALLARFAPVASPAPTVPLIDA